MKQINKALGVLQKVQTAAGGVFLTIFLFTVVFQILSRYLGIVATWTEEVSMYSFIWATFLGAGAMVYEDRHFAFTSVSDMLKNQRAKTILSIFIKVIMLVFSVLMLYYGVLVTKQFWNYKWTTLPQFSRGPVWLCMPLCGATATLYLLGQLGQLILDLVKGGDTALTVCRENILWVT